MICADVLAEAPAALALLAFCLDYFIYAFIVVIYYFNV